MTSLQLLLFKEIVVEQFIRVLYGGLRQLFLLSLAIYFFYFFDLILNNCGWVTTRKDCRCCWFPHSIIFWRNGWKLAARRHHGLLLELSSHFAHFLRNYIFLLHFWILGLYLASIRRVGLIASGFDSFLRSVVGIGRRFAIIDDIDVYELLIRLHWSVGVEHRVHFRERALTRIL